MDKKLLPFRSSFISYHVFGGGALPVLCLHGYGENATSFHFLEIHLGAKYTFYAIDLPFHGDTKWNETTDLLPGELEEILDLILPPHHTTDLSIMGFSLGGRIALSLYEIMYPRIRKLVLVAPDGLKVNAWYWIATQTMAGNRFFHFTMKHPQWFFTLLKGLNKLKLVNSSIFKFVNHYIEDRRVREELYNRWTTLRRFRPELGNIKKRVQMEGTVVRLIYGLHDRMIVASRGRKFCVGIDEQCQLKVLDCGHNVLHPKHVKEIIDSLNN